VSTGLADERSLDALVVDARAGSVPAFTRLWDGLSPLVAGYLRGRGVRAVDEVTNAVFLAAFRGLDRFEGNAAAFRRRLFTIAQHRSVDALRHQPRTTGETRPTGALRLLPGLPTDQRDVLLLRLVGDLSVEDVALVLGRTPEVIRQLHRRAQARLRQLATDPDSVTGVRRLAGRPPPAGPELAAFLGDPASAASHTSSVDSVFMDTASLVRPPRAMQLRTRPSRRHLIYQQVRVAVLGAAATLAQAGIGTKMVIAVGLGATGVAAAGVVSGVGPLPQIPTSPHWSTSTPTPTADLSRAKPSTTPPTASAAVPTGSP
jgi:DNA-directed RNA polymerase specialized sigma24 family protein